MSNLKGRITTLYLPIVIVFALSILVVSCGAPESPEQAVQEVTSTAAEPAEAEQDEVATSTPEALDPRLTTLRIGVSDEPQTFDPHVNVAAVSGYRFYPNIYESLLQYGPDGTLQPMLAESWEVSDDGLVYRFTLRQDVKFSDGTSFDAEAVVASFDRFFALGEGFQAMFEAVEEVTAVDDYVVEIRLSEPYSPILTVLASWQSAIFISPAAIEQNEQEGDSARNWLHDHTAGTGPFMLETWEPENRIVFVRNPHYRESPAPDAIQTVVYQTIREPATLRQLIEEGDLDIVEEIPPSLVEPLRQADGVEVAIDVTHGSSYGQTMYFNLTKEPFDDANFRRAIAYAINYDALVSIWEGVAVKAHGPFPETFSPWFSAEDAVQYEQDMARAEELLREAGYSVPIEPPLQFDLLWQSGQTAQRDMGQLIKEDLSGLGINVEVVETTLPVWREAIWERTFDLAFIQLPLRWNDPDALASLDFHSDEVRYRGWNPGIQNDRVDELIETGLTETDEEQRKEYYDELQKIITEEAYMLFLVNKQHAYAYGSNIEGIMWNPNYGPHYRADQIKKTDVR